MADIIFSKSMNKILDKLDCKQLGKNVAIKVHFGDKGCTTYLNPLYVKQVYNKVIASGKKAALIDCNVLYRGSRTTKKDHIETAISHGFSFAPIDILDGEKGENEIKVKTKNITARLGKGLKKYDSMIVITHFKGHEMAGYGGAVKNIGMGLGSRAGKLHMHSSIRPSVGNKCVGCCICQKNCGSNAISVKGGKAVINKEKCSGCAMCIAVCPNNAIIIPWSGSTPSELLEKMADYAGAVMQLIPKEKMIFINVLEKITKECDCVGHEQKPMMEDIGILMSRDIVSIDCASLDLVNKKSKNKFDDINKINKRFQIDYAEKIGLGTANYKIIKI